VSDIVLEIRCNGEQIEQNRDYKGVIPRKGDMVQAYGDRDLDGDDPRRGGWFRVREIVTVLDGYSSGMKITYLVCDLEPAPKGLFK
jgi:hypothetical protein